MDAAVEPDAAMLENFGWIDANREGADRWIFRSGEMVEKIVMKSIRSGQCTLIQYPPALKENVL